MDQDNLNIIGKKLDLGWVKYFQTIPSTNDYCITWSIQGAPDLSVAIADTQSKGRGRAGRRWVTMPKTALAFSIILKPYSTQDFLPRFTGLGALAVCSAFHKLYDLPSQIKWPNDILISGKKVCGILVESQWEGNQLRDVILGIGVNVLHGSVPEIFDIKVPATCLEDHINGQPDRIELLEEILGQIKHWRQYLKSPMFIRAWEGNLAYKNEMVMIISPDSNHIQGKIVGLDEQGHLRLLLENGTIIVIASSEIHLRPAHIR